MTRAFRVESEAKGGRRAREGAELPSQSSCLVRRNGLAAPWTLRARGLRLGEPVVELGVAPLVAFRDPT